MTAQLATRQDMAAAVERVVVSGDLSQLGPEERVDYYRRVCESLGLNPLTTPFAYITLNGKLKLYALREATDQLRKLHGVSVTDSTDTTVNDVYVVTCHVKDAAGRTDVSKGAVSLKGLTGEALANAIMKAETKAKRRATLSICGLGMLDETEVEDMAAAGPKYLPPTKEVIPPPRAVPPTPVPAALPTAKVDTDVMLELPLADTAPVAKSKPAPVRAAESPERTDVVGKVRKLMLDPPPTGLGWHPKHGEAWLAKYFGVRRPIDLELAQAQDAELLLLARVLHAQDGNEKYYASKIATFFEQKRIRCGDLQ